MQEFLDKFFNYLLTEKCVSNNTFLAYQRDIAQFVTFVQKNMSIDDFSQISSQQVKDFLKYMRHTKMVGPKSSSRKLSALKTLSNYLSKYHDMAPFTQGVAFPKLPKQLPKYITVEQVKALLEVAALDHSVLGQRNKIMICLMYTCGMRVTELVTLKISQIHLAEQCIKVFGKGSKERIIPLPPEMIHMLQAYIEVIHTQLLNPVNAKPLKGAVVKKLCDYLFPVIYGRKVEHITRQTVAKILKSISLKAGLVHGISPHVLRHSLATHLLKQGANLRILQTLLGHEKINTVQVYTHLDIAHLRDLYDMYHPRAHS